MKDEKSKYPCFKGAPNYFRGLVWEASTRQNGYDYTVPSRELARHTYDLLSQAYDLDDPEEVDCRYEELQQLLGNGDEQGVLRWYRRNFPVCMGLIPSKRRAKFARGVFEVYEEGELG